MIKEEVDVLVIGGGTAGAIAAIQAARTGVKVSVIERTGQLGGTITTGGVGAPAHFASRERQLIAGIGWDIVKKTVELDGGQLPDFNCPPKGRPQHHVFINVGLYAALVEEELLTAGGMIHYGEIIVKATDKEDGWSVKTIGKNLEREIKAHELIDCTGDADVVAMLGYERLQGDERQPGTLHFYIDGYDIDGLDVETIEKRYKQALESGEIRSGDFWIPDAHFIDFLAGGGANLQHVFDADSSTAETQTIANIEGRRSLLRLLRFIRTLPGCEQARLQSVSGEVAARETYRIAGETTISKEDYLTGRLYEDAVAYTYYFIDIHREDGVEHIYLDEGVYPTIPLGALIPKGSKRLLVAGRSISSDRSANSALRVQASCMAMGQAAGAAAALGVNKGVPSCDVPFAELLELLRKHGAIVPG